MLRAENDALRGGHEGRAFAFEGRTPFEMPGAPVPVLGAATSPLVPPAELASLLAMVSNPRVARTRVCKLAHLT